MGFKNIFPDRRLVAYWTFKTFFPKKPLNYRMTKLPLIKQIVHKAIFEGDRHYVLPKQNAIQIGRTIEKPDDVVLPHTLIDHFIDQSSYRVIMNFCVCREAMGCRDFPVELGCIFLGETARKIHPDLGRPATKEEAKEHARKCRELGLIHSAGKSKLDTVWLDTGEGEKLFTICSCCPCCCITKGIPYSPKSLTDSYKKLPGVEVTVTDKCIGCGKCSENVCFVQAISMKDGKAVINEECRGCGRCVEICPEKAIVLTVNDRDYVRSAIRKLSEVVNVE